MSTLDIFIQEQKKLLSLEHSAELEEARMLLQSRSSRDLQSEGVALLRLKIEEVSAFFGEYLVTFALNSGHKELPVTRLSNGDVIGIFSGSGFSSEPLTTGVVHAVRKGRISVVVSEIFEEKFLVFSLCLVGNDVTHRRLMDTLEKMIGNRNSLLGVAFGESEISTNFRSQVFCPERNQSQNEAINKCLASDAKISLILGPPGTGKTSTLTSLIAKHLEICRRNFRSPHILVCAPSNAAVDNLAEALLGLGISDIVRLGHPSRISESLEAVSLFARVDASEEAALCEDIRSEISRELKKKDRKSQELKTLRRELKNRMQAAFARTISGCSVVLATCVGAAQLEKIDRKYLDFDFVAIDEAAQAMEISCWLPVLVGNCQRLILAGDHKQLGPTVKSPLAAKLQETLFARLDKKFGDQISSMLTTQYRMNEKIMSWSNSRFYDGKLCAHESVTGRVIADLIDPGASEPVHNFFEEASRLLNAPVIFIDTAFQDEFMELEDEEVSRCNPGEAALIAEYVGFLRSAGVADSQIGVITPYSRQSEVLRSILGSSPQVATVDAFQGREKEVILISTVRSNPSGVVGFLGDERRMNVAVTRAKRQVFIVGNSETLSTDANLKSLISYCESIDSVYSASAFIDVAQLQIPKLAESKNSVPAEHQATAKTPAEPKPRKSKPTNPQAAKISDRQESPEPLRPLVVQELPKISDHDILAALESLQVGASHDFPADLRADDRRRVHEFAESLGLGHDSFGSSDARFIRVTRNAGAESAAPETQEKQVVKPVVKSATPSAKKPVKPETIKAAKQTKGKTSEKKAIEDDDDLDKLLDAEIASLSVCRVCGERPPWTAVTCNYCQRKYCLTHTFPEIHGCGAEARRLARASPKPSPPNKVVQQKLDEAIASKQKLRLGNTK